MQFFRDANDRVAAPSTTRMNRSSGVAGIAASDAAQRRAKHPGRRRVAPPRQDLCLPFFMELSRTFLDQDPDLKWVSSA